MPSVLYQKYRSQDFDELRGQEHITKLLKNAVKSNQISHAYLFVGSRGTGKTSTARILAKAVNCLNLKKDGNPCNECKSCLNISSGGFFDLIEIDAASNRGIDQIRELKEKIEFSPSEGKFKVYIIDEVHMLTTEAFNALLKTLEEPPAHVIFILATTDVHKLPPTILSRCQRYDFRLGTDQEIRKLIEDILQTENIKMDSGGLDIVVQNAKGSYRDALSILDVVYSGQEQDKKEITMEEVRRILGLPDIDQVILLLCSLLDGDGVKALEIIEALESKGVNLQQFTSYILDILRSILTGKIRGKLPKGYDFASDVDIKVIHKLINLFLDAENKMRYANNPILVLEMIIPEMMKTNVNSDITMINRDVKKKIAPVEEKVIEVEAQIETVNNTPKGDLSLDEIKKKWDIFIAEVKPFNGHLYAFLGGANIISYKDGTMSLEVPFKFHKERIEVPKSRNIISDTFGKVYGLSCRVECTVNENVKPKNKSDAEFVLRNLPTAKPSDEKKSEQKEESPFKKKKLSSDIEAMFDGM